MCALLEVFYTAMPDLHVDVEDIVAKGDTVIVRNTHTGTHGGDLFGIAPTGRKVRFPEIATYRVRGGKIVEEWFNADLAGLVQAIS